jgi:hypothetical protein
MRNRLKSTLTCLLAAATLSLGLVASASADTYLGGYNIINQGTGGCLDAFYSYGGGNGNPVGLWTCNDGITETWYIWKKSADFGYPGSYAIRNARGNFRSLDYPASSNGVAGYQYDLWDYYPSLGQVFYIGTDGLGTVISNARAEGIMDAFQSDGGVDGNAVGNWFVTGSPLQHWRFRCVSLPCQL